MRQPEFLHSTDEVKEEEIRLKGKDPEHSTFVPIEEVPSSEINEEEAIAEKIDNKKSKESVSEKLDKEEKLKKEILDKYIQNQKIGYYQDNADVAHVGPDYVDDEKKRKAVESVLAEYSIPEEPENFPYRKSIKEVFKDLVKYGWSSRKERGRNTGAEHDNLKTMSDSKKERLHRAELREIINNGDNFSNN